MLVVVDDEDRENEGDLTLAAEATSVTDLAAALYTILASPAEAKRRRQLGLERAKCFSWRESAHRTLEIYQEAALASVWKPGVEGWGLGIAGRSPGPGD